MTRHRRYPSPGPQVACRLEGRAHPHRSYDEISLQYVWLLIIATGAVPLAYVAWLLNPLLLAPASLL